MASSRSSAVKSWQVGSNICDRRRIRGHSPGTIQGESNGVDFQHLGRHGRWLVANPFSLLTITVVPILLWLGWNALKELLVRESVIVGPRQQKIFRPRFNP